MMLKTFVDTEAGVRQVFYAEDFAELQDWSIQQVIRHTHNSISSRHIKIADTTDLTNPVGLDIPLDGTTLTWQDHVNLPHTKAIEAGRLLARGWTVPTRVRCVVTTPIYDTSSQVPFPTYNMSTLSVNKDLGSAEIRQDIASNRHNPNTYTNYRHYLWILPMNNVCRIHPSHRPILSANTGASIFAQTPLFIHPSNVELRKQLDAPKDTPNSKALSYVPDFSEEKIWSLTEDYTCWLGGYKPILTANGSDIVLFFNDFYNEFFQLISIVNYEELNREYYFRVEKGGGNLSRLECHNLSDITRLMEAKALDTMDISAGAGLARDSIEKRINPYYTKDYYFETDRVSERLKTNLHDSCIEKNGNRLTFFSRGLPNFAAVNDSSIMNDLAIPKYFENGYRQCLVVNGEFGTSRRSFKKMHRGRVVAIYQIVDGFISVPYEIYSSDSATVLNTTQSTIALSGETSTRKYTDITKMGDSSVSGI